MSYEQARQIVLKSAVKLSPDKAAAVLIEDVGFMLGSLVRHFSKKFQSLKRAAFHLSSVLREV